MGDVEAEVVGADGSSAHTSFSVPTLRRDYDVTDRPTTYGPGDTGREDGLSLRRFAELVGADPAAVTSMQITAGSQVEVAGDRVRDGYGGGVDGLLQGDQSGLNFRYPQAADGTPGDRDTYRTSQSLRGGGAAHGHREDGPGAERPGEAQVGESVTFTVADAGLRLDFGDGSEPGAARTHAFAAAGSYEVRALAGDGASEPVAIKVSSVSSGAPPAPGGGGGGGTQDGGGGSAPAGDGGGGTGTDDGAGTTPAPGATAPARTPTTPGGAAPARTPTTPGGAAPARTSTGSSRDPAKPRPAVGETASSSSTTAKPRTAAPPTAGSGDAAPTPTAAPRSTDPARTRTGPASSTPATNRTAEAPRSTSSAAAPAAEAPAAPTPKAGGAPAGPRAPDPSQTQPAPASAAGLVGVLIAGPLPNGAAGPSGPPPSPPAAEAARAAAARAGEEDRGGWPAWVLGVAGVLVLVGGGAWREATPSATRRTLIA